MSDPADDPIDWSAFQHPRDGGTSRRRDRIDGYVNPLTLIGDHCGDKVYGGLRGNLPFLPAYLSAVEVEARWSGSDLGARVIEAIPDEMTREGWELQVQPTEDEEAPTEDTTGPRASLLEQADQIEQRGHADTAAKLRALAATLPRVRADAGSADEGAEIIERINAKTTEIGLDAAINLALKYERAYGGACILIGTDEDGISKGRPLRLDGEHDRRVSKIDAAELTRTAHLDATDPRNLTEPLDWKRVKSITHLVVYTGGWDGEAIGWRYKNDMLERDFGMPEIYMVRNLGVPISGPQAPGEVSLPPPIPGGPGGPTISYIHASRLLVFPGVAADRRVRMFNRGWGVSGFVRVEERLSAFNQTWSAVALLMQELEIKSLGMKGLTNFLTSKNKSDKAIVQTRATEMVRSFSIARMYIHDSEEEMKRQPATLTGVADILREMVIMVAAAAETPLSLLLGQVTGGLGATGEGDQETWRNRVKGKQESLMVPQLRQLYRGLFLAGDSPTGGVEPDRWSIKLRPLKQPTPTEEADRQYKIAQTDALYNTMEGGPTGAEITATRFGGSAYNDGPIVLDLEQRARDQVARERAAKRQAVRPAPTPPGAPTAATPPTAPTAPEMAPPAAGTRAQSGLALPANEPAPREAPETKKLSGPPASPAAE